MRAFKTSFPAFGTVESSMAANVEFQDLAASELHPLNYK